MEKARPSVKNKAKAKLSGPKRNTTIGTYKGGRRPKPIVVLRLGPESLAFALFLTLGRVFSTSSKYFFHFFILAACFLSKIGNCSLPHHIWALGQVNKIGNFFGRIGNMLIMINFSKARRFGCTTISTSSPACFLTPGYTKFGVF